MTLALTPLMVTAIVLVIAIAIATVNITPTVTVTVTVQVIVTWVTESSGKAPYWEMRGFAGREKQAQSGAFEHYSQQPASQVSPGPLCGFP